MTAGWTRPDRPLRIRAIGCDILLRPVYLAAATSPNIVDVVDLSAALHVAPATLRERIQEQVDAVPPGYDAVVLAYGLCGGGTAGLVARDVPVVLSRAHDCITIFLGGRERFAQEFEATPGHVLVRGGPDRPGQRAQGLAAGRRGARGGRRRDLRGLRGAVRGAERRVPDGGRWAAGPQRYERGAFLDVGVPSPDAEARARAEADERGWRFEKVLADLRLVRGLVDGDWDDDRYQVLLPGQTLRMTYDESIMGTTTDA